MILPNFDPSTAFGFIGPQQAPGEPAPLRPPQEWLVDCPYGTTRYARWADEPCDCPDCGLDRADDYALDAAGL